MIYAFFPLLSAIGYGLLYVFLHRAYEGINVITYYFWGGVVQVLAALITWFFIRENIVFNLTTIKTEPLLFCIGALTIASLAWLLALYGIKHTSPVYTALVEVSFPLFTVFFMFLLGNLKVLDWTTVIGGMFVLLGTFILVWAQNSKETVL